jgi:flagellar basal body-associated protein FliL
MGRSLVVAFLAVVGLLCAAGMGYAAYVVSRGSVAVPVTRLQQQPAQQLTPARVRAKAKAAKPRRTVTTTTTRTVPTTAVDDHGGRRGSGSSGHGGDD